MNMPEQIWDRDIEYNEDIVRALAREHFDFKVKSVKLLGEGFDNTVYLINDTDALRMVRREEGLRFANCELIGLPLLPEDLPLQVPRIRQHGKYLNKWDWFLHKKISGYPIYWYGVDGDGRATAAPKIASFLKCLHELPVAPFEAAGLPGDWLGHLNLAKRVPFALAKLEKLVETRVVEERMEYLDLIEEASGLVLDGERCVVHGDFKATHILCEHSEPVGVIDWGDIHIGHPATDLSIAYTFFPLAGRRKFIEEYGLDCVKTWKLAQFRAFFHTLGILEYATFSVQNDLVREAQRALKWMFEK